MIKRRDGWLFLSHSSRDLKLVRSIRNTLEDSGFQPITFFLKSVTDKKELDELIKREIDARRWFVFVNSENSQCSEWAKLELEYAQSKNKEILFLDTTGNYRAQLEAFARRNTVFISHSMRDKKLVKTLKKQISRNDLQVLWNTKYLKDQWPLEMKQQIRSAGIWVLLITENSINSHHVKQEIYLAIDKRKPIFVVRVGGACFNQEIEYALSRSNPVHEVALSQTPTREEFSHMRAAITQFQKEYDL